MAQSSKTRRITIISKIRANFAVFIFITTAIFLMPILMVVELFYNSNKRSELWRRHCLKLVDLLFFLGGLKIQINNFRKLNEPCVYIANHQTGLDGFVILKLLGSKTIAFTGPAKYFPFPFSTWFKKMDYIDVQRNNIEKIKYKESYRPHEALKKACEMLNSGLSILIFPEGHISLLNKLQYFHTGAARLALAADRKIIPVGIVGMHKLIINEIYFKPGKISVSFGKTINPVSYYKKNTLTIKDLTNHLKKALRQLLPKFYYAKNYLERKPEKSVLLLNLDNCLYKGSANRDLIDIVKNKSCYRASLIEKIKKIFCKKSIDEDGKIVIKKFLKNRKATNTYLICKKIFNKKLKFNIDEKIRIMSYNHLKRGHKIILVTSVIAPLAKCFADYINADYWIGEFPHEEKMRYNGEINKGYTKQEQIKYLIKTYNFDMEKSYAIGSEKDFNIFGLAKNKYLVNPCEAIEAKFKRKKDYKIVKTD